LTLSATPAKAIDHIDCSMVIGHLNTCEEPVANAAFVVAHHSSFQWGEQNAAPRQARAFVEGPPAQTTSQTLSRTRERLSVIFASTELPTSHPERPRHRSWVSQRRRQLLRRGRRFATGSPPFPAARVGPAGVGGCCCSFFTSCE